MNPLPDDPAVLELRQYTLKPGGRDVLVELFEREFVEPQEETGMTLIGQFRDRDREDRFVWLRGFADMPARARALEAFYGGPVWKKHRDAANATMIDSDDVLLLKPSGAGAGFRLDGTARAPLGAVESPTSRVVATIYAFDAPIDDAFRRFFDEEAAPILAESGAAPIARLETEAAENTFPRLPVREGEHVFVWFAAFADEAALRAHETRLIGEPRWTRGVGPLLGRQLIAPPARLVLEPTPRSRLR